MKTHVTFCILFALLLIGSAAKAQSASESERLQKAEDEKRRFQERSVRAELDSAIALSSRGKYELADEKFRYVLKNLKAVPSDLTYHFGKNSHMLGQYSQAIDWLNKYIQLKGTSGQYYDDAVAWLKRAEQDLVKQREVQSSEATVILSSRNYEIDCGPTGKVICPVCSGSTVVIRKTYLGDSYKTCPTCKKMGYLNCEEYNKLLRGELKAN